MDPFSFDAEYVARLRDGDDSALRHFTSYFGNLLRIKLGARVRSAALVDDARQETLLRVLVALREGELQQPERLGALVNSTCDGVILEMFRAEGRHAPFEHDTPESLDHREDLEQLLVTEVYKEQVEQVLALLPEKDRDLLTQVFWQERGRDEICRDFGVDRNYLWVLVHRAKSRLWEIMRQQGFRYDSVVTPPGKPLEEMTEAEGRAWRQWLLKEGRRPRPFAWGRLRQTLVDPADELEYDYEPALNRVIERSPDGKRYIVGVRNSELRRLQELKDDGKSGFVPGLLKLSSG